MMRRYLRALTFCLLTLASVGVRADIVVIVNIKNQTPTMTHRQIVDMFMGRNLFFPDGSLALRLDQSPDSPERALFYHELVDKSVAEVNAYWARLLFTGRASPPNPVGDDQAVLKMVRANVSAIGYIDSQYLDDTVRVVGVIK